MAAPSRALAPERRSTGNGLRLVGRDGNRSRLWAVVAVIVIGLMFAMVASNTFVITQQRQIDQANRAITKETARAEALRLQLAELQSPQRITAEAATRLGMIPAPTPIYLQPRADDDARAAEIPASTPPTTAPRATTTTTPKSPTTTVKR